MAEFPALPIFTDAITADCAHLNDAEFGLYFRILMLMWRSPGCRIPHDEQWITRKLARPWSSIKPLLDEFCTSTGNWYTQKRLSKEWAYLMERRKNNTMAANRRWGNPVDNSTASHAHAHTPARGEKSPDDDKQLKFPVNEQCERNAPHSTPLHPINSEVKKPSTEQEPAKAKGFEKNRNDFDITLHLRDYDYEQLRESDAPGWDINGYLAPIYNEKVRKGTFPVPDKPGAAFRGWCRKYVKDKAL